MIGKIYFSFVELLIDLIDRSNKKKVLRFFKDKIDNKFVNLIDIGAHKGETIDLFINNFDIENIYAFEPNYKLFNNLKLNKKYQSKKIKLFNLGVGEVAEKKELNIFKDSSSSTINQINENTKYFKRKKKIMFFFSKSENFLITKQPIQICNLSEFINNESINKIDILKIDTEGYEFNILKGLTNSEFNKIRWIYFEHHYDLMILKGYKFKDINNILKINGFVQKFKIKMKFRKTFEYIYERI